MAYLLQPMQDWQAQQKMGQTQPVPVVSAAAARSALPLQKYTSGYMHMHAPVTRQAPC